MLEKPGALMMYPIYQLLFGKHSDYDPASLELTENDVAISYKVYKSGKAADRQAIIDGSLTPGRATKIE